MSNWRPSAEQMKAMGLTGLGSFVRVDKHTERIGVLISPGQALINGETIHESGKRVTLRNGFISYEDTDLTHAEVERLLRPLFAKPHAKKMVDMIPADFWKAAEERFPQGSLLARNFGCVVKPIDLPTDAELREGFKGIQHGRPGAVKLRTDVETASGIDLDAASRRLCQAINTGFVDRCLGETDYEFRERVLRTVMANDKAADELTVFGIDWGRTPGFIVGGTAPGVKTQAIREVPLRTQRSYEAWLRNSGQLTLDEARKKLEGIKARLRAKPAPAPADTQPLEYWQQRNHAS